MNTKTQKPLNLSHFFIFSSDYFIVSIIPTILFLLLQGIYFFTSQKCIPGLLSLRSLPFIILASGTFFYFIQHSRTISLSQKTFAYLFSFAYSFCSYALLQETSVESLLLYAVFPIIFYCFELMMVENKIIPFVIACTVMMYIEPQTGITAALLLLILALLWQIELHNCHFGDFIKLLFIFIFSFGLAAARIVFYLAPYFADHQDYTYTGFSLSYAPIVFLSRFLLGASASRTISGASTRVDLYFGILPLIIFLLFFFQKEITFRQKSISCINTLIIVAILEFSPVQYVFNFFHTSYRSTYAISFFLIFWMLYVGMRALQHIEKITNREILLSGFSFLSLSIIIFLWSAHDFPSEAFIFQLLFFISYIIFLCKYNHKTSYRFCLLVFTTIELFIAGYITTNISYCPSNSSTNALFAFHEHSSKNTPVKSTSTDSSVSKYNKFVKNYSDDSVTENLSTLLSLATLSDNEKEKYCNTPFPDIFQEINGICKKLGISGTLFKKQTVSLKFSPSNKYTIVKESNDLYNISSANGSSLSNGLVPFKVNSTSFKKNTILYQFDNVSGNLLRLNSDFFSGTTTDYLLIDTPKSKTVNFTILFYEQDNSVYKNVTNYLKSHTTDKSTPSYLMYDYVGIGISIFSLMILMILCCYDNKENIWHVLNIYHNKANNCPLAIHLGNYICYKRIYIFSFLIPFIIYIIAMVINDAGFFGSNTLFGQDGIWSSIPTILDNYYKYDSNNTFLSMNIGYGSDLSLSYTIHLLSKIYHFIPLSMIVPTIELLIALGIGFCGLNMTIYMTHRLKCNAASSQDFRLLLPAVIYALCAYSLAVHEYPTWYLVLMLFPLVMLAMDRLMLTGHWILYTVLLGAIIFLELQLAMFVCIYLVINFFTYKFTHIKDFFKKGIRFTYASLLAGGCGFLTVYRTLASYHSSGYTDSDSSFPVFGFFGSFWKQWGKLLLYTPAKAASADSSNICLYCGIITLILVGIYFVYKQESISDKLRYLLPIVLLLVSFNEQILSYLWNGMHYQSNCPNRYVFLLTFLLAQLAYEGLLLLPDFSSLQLQRIILSTVVFIILCYTFTTERITLALISTLIFVLIYCFILFIYRKQRTGNTRKFYYYILFIALIEISSNALYTSTNWGSGTIHLLGNYTKISKTINQTLDPKNTYYRITVTGNRLYNFGQYYNTGCLAGFGTCISQTQLYLHYFNGFSTTVNSMITEYPSTPLNIALANCQYLFLPITTNHPVLDLYQYKYLGSWQNYYIFKTKNTVSLGYYLPSEGLSSDMAYFANPIYYNQIASQLLPNGKTVYENDSISYTENPSTPNSYYYTDAANNVLSRQEAIDLFNSLPLSLPASTQIKVHINYTAPSDGSYYLYPSYQVALGKLEKGNNQITIGLPGDNLFTSNKLDILLYHNDIAQELLTTIRKNELTNVKIENDTITGFTNYQKAGYTTLSLGYSKNWHAYVDGKEVKTLNPYNSNLVIPTPAGKHKITLKFIPQYLKECQIITLCFWLLCCILYVVPSIYRKKRRK